ncbi:CLUMA_CG006828, isoform A [Clunio marinus]|uniref:CLUMA_CG006828, isoform A n=1 Tax=Clunio marinus TaxID=568069 RepID=A0A1J1HZ31_9DIPT|nr:CLUMA_CG006828, isoform A [Clunio marinus]
MRYHNEKSQHESCGNWEKQEHNRKKTLISQWTTLLRVATHGGLHEASNAVIDYLNGNIKMFIYEVEIPQISCFILSFIQLHCLLSLKTKDRMCLNQERSRPMTSIDVGPIFKGSLRKTFMLITDVCLPEKSEISSG